MTKPGQQRGKPKMKNQLRSLKMVDDRYMKLLLIGLSIFISTVNKGAAAIFLDGEEWPKEFKIDENTFIVYQPELESYENNQIEARSAISVRRAKKEPIFGIMWFTGNVEINSEIEQVFYSNLKVEYLRFPEMDDENLELLEFSLKTTLSTKRFTVSKGRFDKDLNDISTHISTQNQLQTIGPYIYYMEQSSVLVLIDGEPILKKIEGTFYKYIVNTPYFIIFDPAENHYYLKGGKWWYKSKNLIDSWTLINTPPKEIRMLAKKAFSGDSADTDNTIADMTSPPKVIVSTIPAELIVTNGTASLTPVTGTNLLYVDNSENDILLDIKSQRYYVLISGRWYSAKSLTDNNWTFVSPEKLPVEFLKLPDDSPVASVRTNIAGTPEAKEAVLNNSVPRTTKVKRKFASLNVKFDGEPEFEQVDNTGVAYAVNSEKVVLKINGHYYCVDNGIWYDSYHPDGAWHVSTVVPDEIQDIPPSSPVHYVKYVYIYDYTPSHVYVGYTPGYHGSYEYYGTVVYGSGCYYRPWHRRYYFPRPLTYGFGAHYNVYSGWGFSVGVSYGWLAFSWRNHRYGYWGPSGYNYGYRHGYYHRDRHSYYRGYRNGHRHGYSGGRVSNYRSKFRHHNNHHVSYKKHKFGKKHNTHGHRFNNRKKHINSWHIKRPYYGHQKRSNFTINNRHTAHDQFRANSKRNGRLQQKHDSVGRRTTSSWRNQKTNRSNRLSGKTHHYRRNSIPNKKYRMERPRREFSSRRSEFNKSTQLKRKDRNINASRPQSQNRASKRRQHYSKSNKNQSFHRSSKSSGRRSR